MNMISKLMNRVMYAETPSIVENGNTRGKQTKLYFKRVAIIRSKLYQN